MSVKEMKLTEVSGGVCAAEGFFASGVHCGLRKNKQKPDLAFIYSEQRCPAAAVYTQNKVQGAPIQVTKKHLTDPYAQGVIINSGNANTCNPDGEQKAVVMCETIAQEVGIAPSDVLVASTGIIGESLPVDKIVAACPKLKDHLSREGNAQAATAILTTDTCEKEYAVAFEWENQTVKIGGIAKGSGMIHPNMATMLCFVTTDLAIEPAVLQTALSEVSDETFNMISVDGDTSTNDMVTLLASGKVGNPPISTVDSPGYTHFKTALYDVLMNLSKKIAQDGEGASKLLECQVTGAQTKKTAKAVAKSIITSSLVKSAMFGQDPNWGRILCAIGYAEGDFDIQQVKVDLASVHGRATVCLQGARADFDYETLAEILKAETILILVDIGTGAYKATAWGCDLTYDYVKINADYHT
ncbi:bifunctional glutamate N-acetyltransferase/amino-acid acetyltransferase ArgJ [Enterococcus sp. LJL98]